MCCSTSTGVTRDSIIQLARLRGYDVQEDKVSVTEAMEVCGQLIYDKNLGSKQNLEIFLEHPKLCL